MKTHALVYYSGHKYLNTSRSNCTDLPRVSQLERIIKNSMLRFGAILNPPKSRFSGYTGE